MEQIRYLVEPLVLATDFKMVFAIHLCWLQPTLFSKKASVRPQIFVDDSRLLIDIFKKSSIFAAFLEYNKNDVSAISGAMAQGGLL